MKKQRRILKKRTRSGTAYSPAPEPLEAAEESGRRRGRGSLVRFAIAAFLLLAGLVWLVNQNKAKQTELEISQGTKSPDAVIEKFHLISSVSGEKRWELFSNRAELYQNQKQAFADNIYAQYFRKNKIVSTLTADRAVISTDTNDTRVNGHVELITQNGSKLETDRLNWDPNTDEIKTDARVHVYKGMDDITAVGLQADTQLNNVQFLRDVHTRLRDTNEMQNFDKPKRF